MTCDSLLTTNSLPLSLRPSLQQTLCHSPMDSFWLAHHKIWADYINPQLEFLNFWLGGTWPQKFSFIYFLFAYLWTVGCYFETLTLRFYCWISSSCQCFRPRYIYSPLVGAWIKWGPIVSHIPSSFVNICKQSIIMITMTLPDGITMAREIIWVRKKITGKNM